MSVFDKWKTADLKSRITNAICLFVIIASIPYGIYWLSYRFTHAITNDAFVESDLINMTPRVPGHIKELLVDESSAKTISMPSLVIFESATGDCGLAKAKTIKATAVRRK